MKKYFLLAAILLSHLFVAAQSSAKIQPVSDEVFNSLAPTPPMGWNSWNKFGCNVNEKMIMEMADAMVSSGMKDAGYEYIVIDDCWQVDRDQNGNIIADSKAFPHGIKYLADYIHKKGLKFGIYSCAGSLTCAGRPGGRGHQYQDAIKYAEWGVDYLKYDWCFNEEQSSKAAYKTMSDALKASGRPIVFSLCEWGSTKPWTWAKGIGQLWRATGDITDHYESINDWGGLGMVNIVDLVAPLYKYAGPNHWNDADMLEIGNGGMTNLEYITHMSLWCMMASPLMSGNDIRNMDEATKTILLNKEVIAINQDKKGIQGHPYIKFGEHEVWGKTLDNGDVAVCFFNRGNDSWNMNFKWNELSAINHNINYEIRDLWKHKVIGNTSSKSIKSEIPAHGVLMVRLIK